MKRSLKNKGSIFSVSNPNNEKQRHAEKIKSIERVIIADF